MNKNHYDDPHFFHQYAQMIRSKEGLKGAGEWKTLEAMLPDFKDKSVLDLGCGYGWHCQYAYEHGARKVIGIDLSEKMLEVAKQKTNPAIQYLHASMQDFHFDESFDVVLSSLAIHYLEDYEHFIQCVHEALDDGGEFIFSIEHPIFTAEGSQQWVYTPEGQINHFPVDRYFDESLRMTDFLDTPIEKYHRTLTTLITTLLRNGFELLDLQEPTPPKEMLPALQDELRRPMMLLIRCKKK